MPVQQQPRQVLEWVDHHASEPDLLGNGAGGAKVRFSSSLITEGHAKISPTHVRGFDAGGPGSSMRARARLKSPHISNFSATRASTSAPCFFKDGFSASIFSNLASTLPISTY